MNLKESTASVQVSYNGKTEGTLKDFQQENDNNSTFLTSSAFFLKNQTKSCRVETCENCFAGFLYVFSAS
jgi:hypothetical protein